MNITRSALLELRDAALAFVRKSRWVKPRIFTGHPVAHHNPSKSKITNFSTITHIVTTCDNQRFFLMYRYPLSWIHSITDNIQRWGSGRPSSKPFRRVTWQRRCEQKSRIPLVPMVSVPNTPYQMPGLVVMPYIPNYNLWDILRHNQPGLSTPNVLQAIMNVAHQINGMHAQGKYWGELIVNNIILREDNLEPVICDAEAEYWSRVNTRTRAMHDWRDFIFSVAGAIRNKDITPRYIARFLFNQIDDQQVREQLRRYSRKPRTLGQVLFWQGFGGYLSCSWSTYTEIRETIAGLTI